ncbi:extensin-like [Capsicum annuum]|uniref:extensin-like n=1 Tax=Capsicum annuum TaxID=4072 RepID=UPI001FB04E45|nr:extensin-like [Capsicum annuum]
MAWINLMLIVSQSRGPGSSQPPSPSPTFGVDPTQPPTLTFGPRCRPPSPLPAALRHRPPVPICSPSLHSYPPSPSIPPLRCRRDTTAPLTSVSSQLPLGLQPPIRSPTAEARSSAAASPAPAARSPAAAVPKRRPVHSVSSSRNSISAPESPGTRSTLGFGFELGLQA